MSHIISLKVAKFQQPLLITLGVADEKPEGGGKKTPPPRKIGLTQRHLNVKYTTITISRGSVTQYSISTIILLLPPYFYDCIENTVDIMKAQN